MIKRRAPSSYRLRASRMHLRTLLLGRPYNITSHNPPHLLSPMIPLSFPPCVPSCASSPPPSSSCHSSPSPLLPPQPVSVSSNLPSPLTLPLPTPYIIPPRSSPPSPHTLIPSLALTTPTPTTSPSPPRAPPCSSRASALPLCISSRASSWTWPPTHSTRSYRRWPPIGGMGPCRRRI